MGCAIQGSLDSAGIEFELVSGIRHNYSTPKHASYLMAFLFESLIKGPEITRIDPLLLK